MKKSKKIIALLCTICILATSLVFAFRTKAEKPLETLDPTMEQVTFRDYGEDIDGTYYAKNGGDNFAKIGYYKSLEGKVFSGNITFSEGPGYVYFGGSDDNPWRGLSIAGGVDGVEAGCLALGFGDDTHILNPQVADCQLVGKEFPLKLTYEVIEKNGEDTLKLGVWFDDKLYNNDYFYVSSYKDGTRDYTNYLTPYLAIRPVGNTATITVRSDDPKAEEKLDSTLELVSFNTYGIDNGNYTSTVEGKEDPVLGEFVVNKFYNGDLAGKVFSADVTFSERPAYLYFGDKNPNSAWGGFYFASGQDDMAADSLLFSFGDKTYEFKSSVAGLKLVGNPFNLKLSYQVVDNDGDGEEDSLKLGVWFNGKLYNNGYFYLSTYKNGTKDYTNYLGGWCGIVMGTRSSYLTIKSDVIQVLDKTMPKITFKDYGIADDTYTYDDMDAEKGYAKRGSYWESLEGKVFSGDVTFTEADTYLHFGDKEDHWNGFYFASGLNTDEPDSLQFKFGDNTYTLTPEIAGTPLVGEPFNLKLSYQVIDADEDEQKDTLQLGVWFNDKLYNNKYFYLSTYENGTKDYTYYLSGFLTIQPNTSSAAITVESDVPKVLDPTLEKITFSTYGTKMKDGIYTYNNGEFAVRGAYWENLNGKVFSGDVTFSEADAYLYFGDASGDGWGGFSFASGQYDDDLDALQFKIGDDTYKLTPEIAGRALVGESVNLKLSYQVIDKDKDGTNDTLQLGVWFKDVLYNNKYFYVSSYAEGTKDYSNYMQGYCGIQPASVTASITIASEKSEEPDNPNNPDTPEKPEILNPDLTQITFRDYGIANDVYTYDKDKEYAKRGTYWESLEGKVFSGDVTFTEAAAYLYFGDKESHWNGFYFASGQDKNDLDSLQFKLGDDTYTLTPEIAGDAIVGESVNLKLSYEVIDKDNNGTKDTLQLGVWFNDVLYNNKYFYVSTYANGTKDYTYYLTGFLTIQPVTSKSSITVASEEPKKPVVTGDPEVLNPKLTQITFRDYGIMDDTYGYSGDLTAKGFYNDSLAGKVFSGDVKFTKAASHLFIGGEPNSWYGISVASGQPGCEEDWLLLTIGDKKHVIYPDVAGVALVDSLFNLKLSYEVVDQNGDGAEDALKLGVWINNKLYANEYYYITTYKHLESKYGTRDYKDFLTGYMGIFPSTKSATLTIGSDAIEKLDASMPTITFSNFGIQDGTYKFVNGLAAEGTYKDGLSGKVFAGDIMFSEAPAYLYIGGEPNVQNGISIASGQEGVASDCLIVTIGDAKYTLSSAVVGTPLVGQTMNLKISYQETDTDQDGKNDILLVGIWINGKLYQNEYFKVNSYKDFLTGRVGLYPAREDASLTVASDMPEVLDPSLEKITFTDFAVNNGTYNTVGGFKVGFYNGKLDGKVFSGNVTFSKKRSDLWIGAVEDPWYGLGILSGYHKDKTLLTVMYAGKEYLLEPKVAGTTLVENKFNLKLSYQLVDTNNDGKKDTLQLGIWINDRLYNDEYMYIQDYENCIGPYMAIHTPYEGSYMTVESDVVVANPAKGSRSLSSPPTGDTAEWIVYISLAVMALIGIVWTVRKQRLE